MRKGFNQQYKGKKPVFFIFILVGLFATSAAVMYLWNKILPQVTGIKPITYWQAMGIFVLSRLLFGNFGLGGKTSTTTDHPHPQEKLKDLPDEER